MQYSFLLCNIYLVNSQLLTHKVIGEKIAEAQGLFNEKQKEWFEKNKNNGLVLFDYVSNFKFAEIIMPIINRYLKETKNTSVYVVVVVFLPNYTQYYYNTMSLVKYASDIIKECVKTNKPFKQEKYGLIWKCWKIAPDDDYKKLKEQINTAGILYIDGFCDGHDSFEKFISHYFYDTNLLFSVKYQTVINLQKAIGNNKTYIDVTEIGESLLKHDFFERKIEIVKFLNCKGEAILDTIRPQEENQTFVIGDHYKIKKIPGKYANIEISNFYCNGSVPLFKYMQKVIHEQYKFEMFEDLNKIKKDKFKNLDLKIINYDAIKICTQKNDVYGISFTTFVKEKKQEIKIIQDNTENKCNTIFTNYEAVIIVGIHTCRDIFKHIITYPVLDANGQSPVIDYDTEDIYYKELIKQHDKVQKMLDTICDIYQNDCIIDDKKSLLLHEFFDLEEQCLRRYSKITEKLKLENTDIPYHQQNIEFIKNLQSKFGENITIELHNIMHEKVKPRSLYSHRCYCDFSDHYLYKNKIDTKTYLETKHNNDNNDVILMVFNIKNTKDEDSTYYFIHKIHTNQKDRISINKYLSENSKFIFAKLNTKTKEKLYNKYGTKKALDDNLFNKAIYEHLVSKIPLIISYIKKDYNKFIKNDYNFYQKLYLHIKNETTDLIKEKNINTNQPFLNKINMNNMNGTINHQIDQLNIFKQENITNWEFIVSNYARFNEINEFMNVLIQSPIKLMEIVMIGYYSDLLKCMRNILFYEILKKYNSNIERSRKLYLQVKQITAPKDTYDTLKTCINETFLKK